jgi:hypothetical protein
MEILGVNWMQKKEIIKNKKIYFFKFKKNFFFFFKVKKVINRGSIKS